VVRVRDTISVHRQGHGGGTSVVRWVRVHFVRQLTWVADKYAKGVVHVFDIHEAKNAVVTQDLL
jgi:hypothetical protein